jgi:hypothetical protein
VASFIGSFSGKGQVVVHHSPKTSKADELQKLASLKEQGLLTDDAFNQQKQLILEGAL